MNKIPDYQYHVRQVLLSEANQPFLWGTRDCCMFSAKVADAMYGTDFEERFRSTYSSPRQAIRLVRDRGGLPNLITSVVGVAPRIPLDNVSPRMGDIVLHWNGSKYWQGAIGIMLRKTAVFKANQGTVQYNFHDCEYFWRLDDASRTRNTSS